MELHRCPLYRGRQPQGTFSPAPGRSKALAAQQPQGTDSPVLSHQEGSVEQPIRESVSLHLVASEAQSPRGTDSPARDHSSPSQLQQFRTSLRTGTPSPAPSRLLARPLLLCRTSVLSHPRAPSSHNQPLQCLRGPPSVRSHLPKTVRRGRLPPTSSSKEDPETHLRSNRGSPSGQSRVNQLPASDSRSPHPHPDPSQPHRNQRCPPQPTPRQTNSAS